MEDLERKYDSYNRKNYDILRWLSVTPGFLAKTQPTKLFDNLRELAVSQGIIKPGSQSAETGSKMRYYFLGAPVCRDAYATLMGVSWSPRLSTLLKAVLRLDRTAPMDARYMERPHTDAKPVYFEVFSYLQSLYESVAETLPLDDKKSSNKKNTEIWSEDEDSYNVSKSNNPNEETEMRFLPPGTIFDLWRQFLSTSGQKCSWQCFHSCFRKDFGHKLTFRDKYLFSVCPVCVQHKLLIKHLSADLNGRVRQRALYERHLASQLRDRKCYWAMRASSRIQSKQIVAIIDGMDQGKYGTPRSRIFDSHSFDKYTRPRLHVWGLLCHGYIAWLSVSDADVSKGGSTTVELVLHMLSVLAKHNVQLDDVELTIQLDNTGSSNKNNTVLTLASYLTQKRIVGSCRLSFLRVGHTHEVPVTAFKKVWFQWF